MHFAGYNRFGAHSILYLLSLIALAMVEMAQPLLILPLLFPAVAAYAYACHEHKTGYLSVVLTVCKTE